MRPRCLSDGHSGPHHLGMRQKVRRGKQKVWVHNVFIAVGPTRSKPGGAVVPHFGWNVPRFMPRSVYAFRFLPEPTLWGSCWIKLLQFFMSTPSIRSPLRQPLSPFSLTHRRDLRRRCGMASWGRKGRATWIPGVDAYAYAGVLCVGGSGQVTGVHGSTTVAWCGPGDIHGRKPTFSALPFEVPARTVRSPGCLAHRSPLLGLECWDFLPSMAASTSSRTGRFVHRSTLGSPLLACAHYIHGSNTFLLKRTFSLSFRTLVWTIFLRDRSYSQCCTVYRIVLAICSW